MNSNSPESIPLPTIRRYPEYLIALNGWRQAGKEWVSTTELGNELGRKPIGVRKDLAFSGVTGLSRKGFRTTDLIEALRNALGWNNPADAFLVGLGSIGRALLGYEGFSQYGLEIVAAFDSDEKVRTEAAGLQKVFPLGRLPDLASRMKIKMGIIAVPDSAAQETANLLVSAGIKGIWNFAPVNLKVPDGVIVKQEDLSHGLAVLSYKLNEHG